MARLILLVLAVSGLSFPAATRTALLIDRSGSMAPYYADDEWWQLANMVHSTFPAGAMPDVIAFSIDNVKVPNLRAVENVPLGNKSLLDRAVENAISLQYEIVWMITDNIEDRPQDEEAGNTEVFYRILRGPGVRRVVIFPVLQASGKSGIAVYALLLSQTARARYEQQIKDFEERAGGSFRTEGLRMKPLDVDTVSVELREPEKRKRRRRLEFEEGKPLRYTVSAQLRSRFQHLRIVDAEIAPIESAVRFDGKSLLECEKRQAYITPKDVTINPGESTQKVYEVTIDLGTVRLKKGIGALFRAGLGVAAARKSQFWPPSSSGFRSGISASAMISCPDIMRPPSAMPAAPAGSTVSSTCRYSCRNKLQLSRLTYLIRSMFATLPARPCSRSD